MGRKEKLLSRFMQLPKDFTFDETLGIYIDLHRPHPGSVMKQWMIKAIYIHLKANDLI
jgi:hypothetical protein